MAAFPRTEGDRFMLTVGIHGIPDKNGSGHAHDHGIALIRNGVVIAHLPAERLTHNKHDGNLPLCFDALLRPFLVPNEEIRFILVSSFYGDSFTSESESLSMTVPEGFNPEDIMAPCHIETKGYLKKHRTQGWAISHELAHIASCLPFCGTFSENALLLHIDGGASVSANSVWTYNQGNLRCLSYDWDSLKRVVNHFNASVLSQAILGLRPEDHLSMPGKLMGFSGHGTANPYLMDLIQNHDPISTNFSCMAGSSLFQDLIDTMKKNDDPTRLTVCADIAASMQMDFEHSIVEFIGQWKKKTAYNHLYYSGGAALNIHTNVRIENELGFDHIFVPPAPSDGGLALGAAAMAEWQERRHIERCSPFIVRCPRKNDETSYPVSDATISEIAGTIADRKVIGTVIGHGECGPRALGHRSILARPDSIEIRKHISEVLKKREWYRPVSPIMLEDTAKTCLEEYRQQSCLGEYMSGAWKISASWLPHFQGVVHADGSVRAQIVRKNSAELSSIYRLLVLLRDKYGIHGLLNTSFNQSGEPIVQDISDALRSGRAMGLDALWIEKLGQSELRYL